MVRTRASTATAPSGRAISGLTSSSRTTRPQVEGQALDGHDRLDQGVAVDREPAPGAVEEGPPPDVVDNGPGLPRPERRQPEAHVAQDLGKHPAQAEHHDRAEDLVVGHPEDRLHPADELAGDQHAVHAAPGATSAARASSSS